MKERLLPRIFGFELLMAPYAIAHLKLGLFLEETGYQFDSGKRLGVYLTNTLEEAAYKSESLFEEFVAEESDQASMIKRDQPVMLVIGNPPYSGDSTNRGIWIDQLLKSKNSDSKKLKSYYEVDGKPLGERKLWLQDDYVKFIRWGQWRISCTNSGILSFVSNHSYIDTPTSRGMRHSLMQTFDEILILDLHGNNKKKEQAPNGLVDKNVFDIQQGVAIGFFIRSGDNNKNPMVKRSDLWGTRESKNNQLSQSNINLTQWSLSRSSSPFYSFTISNEQGSDEYKTWWKINDIMKVNVVGVQTSRDHFVFDFTNEELLARIREFADLNLSDEDIREKYFKGKGSSKYPDGDTRGWKLSEARKKVRNDLNWNKRIVSW